MTKNLSKKHSSVGIVVKMNHTDFKFQLKPRLKINKINSTPCFKNTTFIQV